MKIDTNMLLILLAAGGAALYFFTKKSSLNTNDQQLAAQLAAQQQMNQQQQAMLLKAMADIKSRVGASKDDNPWDDPESYAMLIQAAGTIVGAVGSFF